MQHYLISVVTHYKNKEFVRRWIFLVVVRKGGMISTHLNLAEVAISSG